jgi:hypothetical protein
MKLKEALTKVLTNKLVLKIVAILALFNVIGYMVMGKLNSLLFFAILAVLVRYFSKNMIIILGIPLIVVNLFSIKGEFSLEGMENNKDDNGRNNNGTNDNGTNDNGRDRDNKKKLAVADEKDVSGNITSSNDPGDKSGFEVGRKKNGSAKIDYATTIEDAYDDLNQILGSDGIKNLTDDTQRLMKQQMELAKSMEAMTPLVQQMLPMAEKAKDMMASMDNNNGDMSGLLAMAQKMSGNLGGANKKQ